MQTSESIASIATALSAFQGEVEDAPRDTQGHNYRYADLHTVLGIIRPLMSKYGLALAQFPVGDPLQVGVTSVLMHESGEWMMETYYMGITDGRGMSAAQSAGLVVTYCRRYAAAAILGLTQMDEDAEVEEPEIVPASDEQYAEINEYVKQGAVSKRRLSWLQVEKNWNNLTSEQAKIILNEIKGI